MAPATEGGLLLLLDGYSLLFRAYYAMAGGARGERVLRTSSGVPTGALYGFTSMLAKVVSEQRPTHLAVALDAAAPTFRDEALASYKATRTPTPEDLREQLEASRAVIGALAIPALEVPGFEADDVIATLARRAAKCGLVVRIVTGDRDLLQLVRDPSIAVLLTRKGVSNLEIFDEAKVLEHYGVPPWRYGDLAALRGDSSDNLPGVAGIGPKTAAVLLARFGSLEGILEHLEALTPRQREAIEAARDDLLLGRALTELRDDVEPLPAIEELRLGPWDPARAEALLVGTYELRRPFAALEQAFAGRPRREGSPREGAIRPASAGATSVPEPSSLKEVLDVASDHGTLALVARYGGEPGRSSVLELGLAARGRWWRGPVEDALEPLGAIVADLDLVGAAPKEFVRSLALVNGVELVPRSLVDLEVLGWLVDSADVARGVRALAERWLGWEQPRASLLEDGVPDGEDPARVVLVEPLANALWERLRRDELEELARSVEIPLTWVLTRMELRGVAVDVARLDAIGAELASERDAALADVQRWAGEPFNPNSPKQLAQVLFERLGLPAGRRTKTGYSTDARVLEGLRDAHPIVPALLRFRELDKLLSTFYEGLRHEIAPDGRIHATFNQAVARTGRISSERPNLQNIPVRSDEGKRFRDVFVAGAQMALVAADYSQIELRVLAHLSGDEELVRILSGQGDVHAMVASRVFGVPLDEVTAHQRTVAKMVTYGLSYGMEAYGLAQRLGVPTPEAEAILADFFDAFPGLRAYRDRSVQEARERGYTTTLLGRRRYLPDLTSPNRSVRQSAERQAMNAATQGLAADIFKIALVRLHDALRGYDAALVLQVHDEVVVEARATQAAEVCAVVVDVLEHAFELRVPLRVQAGIGATWGGAKGD